MDLFDWLYRHADPMTVNIILGVASAIGAGIGAFWGLTGTLIGGFTMLIVAVLAVKMLSSLNIA